MKGPDGGVKRREWSVKVDLNAPVDDFHQRVPNMAHKVHAG